MYLHLWISAKYLVRSIIFAKDPYDVQDVSARRRAGGMRRNRDRYYRRHVWYSSRMCDLKRGRKEFWRRRSGALYRMNVVYLCFDSGRGNFFSLFGSWEYRHRKYIFPRYGCIYQKEGFPREQTKCNDGLKIRLKLLEVSLKLLEVSLKSFGRGPGSPGVCLLT